MTGKRPQLPLTPEDRALWDEIKKRVEPLKTVRVRPEVAAKPQEPDPPKPAVPASVKAPAQKIPPPGIPGPPPLASLDRRARSRISRGQVEIGARLDLHGMTLERARSRLKRFLLQSQDEGVRLALVITGKGTTGRGVLRHEVPLWLALPEFRTLVIGFDSAAPTHGGEGALYVRIRRRS